MFWEFVNIVEYIKKGAILDLVKAMDAEKLVCGSSILLFKGVSHDKKNYNDRNGDCPFRVDDVARQMEVLVKSAILDYAQEAGVSDNAQVIQFAETISVQITKTTLRGCKTEKVEQGTDETLYALVVCPVSLLQDEAAEEFKRNEEAAYSEFKAREAERWLEEQINGRK